MSLGWICCSGTESTSGMAKAPRSPKDGQLLPRPSWDHPIDQVRPSPAADGQGYTEEQSVFWPSCDGIFSHVPEWPDWTVKYCLQTRAESASWMRSEPASPAHSHPACPLGTFAFWWGRAFNFSFVVKILEQNVISRYSTNENYDLTDNECLDK